MNYNFDKDLSIAEVTEDRIAQFFESKGIKFIDKNYTNEYDIKVKEPSGRMFTIEIKEDFMCKDTNNIAIEFYSRGKPSGILVTKADYILYRVHETESLACLYIIKTDKLKQLLVDGKYVRKVSGGDKGSDTRSYLMNLETVKMYFKNLGTL